MHVTFTRCLSLTRCTTHCPCDDAPSCSTPVTSIAHRHPRWPLDRHRRIGRTIHDGKRDIKHRPSAASEPRPHGPGATTPKTWTSAGPSQRSTIPDSPSTGSDESSPPQHPSPQPAPTGGGALSWPLEPPGTAARAPLAVQPALRDGSTQLHIPAWGQARHELVNELARPDQHDTAR
jgi:hypothetical protein